MPDTKEKAQPLRKVVFVKVRCTEEERQQWQARASAECVTVSDLLRRGADMPTGKPKSRPVVRKVAEADPALVRQLAQIGNNVNQLARAVNMYGFEPDDSARLLAYLSAVRGELEALREQAEAAADAQ